MEQNNDWETPGYKVTLLPPRIEYNIHPEAKVSHLLSKRSVAYFGRKLDRKLWMREWGRMCRPITEVPPSFDLQFDTQALILAADAQKRHKMPPFALRLGDIQFLELTMKRHESIWQEDRLDISR